MGGGAGGGGSGGGGLGGDVGGEDGEGVRQPAFSALSPAKRKLRPKRATRLMSGPLPAASYRSLLVFASAVLPTSSFTKTVMFERLRNKKVTARFICWAVSANGSLGFPSS